MKHPIQRRLMYLGFHSLRVFAQCLPFEWAQAIGRAVGSLACHLLSGQRRLAEEHLALALAGSLTPEQRHQTVRAMFRNLGQNMMEWFVLPKLSMEAIQQLVGCDGVEHVRAALSKGNGAIMVTAHFGNWELIPIYLRGLGFEGGVLARRLRYPEYESYLTTMRGARGVSTLARGSVKEVAKLLRANQIIGVLPDQDIDSLEGIFVDFFHQPAYTPVGPAALSLMTGAPIVPCFMKRSGGRFHLIIEPALPVPQFADRAEAIAELTKAWSATIESYIRRDPDHWVWMHRRWKTQPTATSDQQPITDNKRSAFQRSHAAPGRSHTVVGQPPTALRSVYASSHAFSCLLAAGYLSLVAALTGCNHESSSATTTKKSSAEPTQTQQMSSFTLTGYQQNGGKRWQLQGKGANIDGNIVTIHQPDAIGFDVARTAYITASAAQVNQENRHVRLEHDVTIHTTDGLWLTSPVLHWMPDDNRVVTDLPVRIETDHILLRGRGANGLTQLKQAVIERDVELVLNPTDHDLPTDGHRQVTITCDGPLSFDYEHQIATFEHNVHVQDPHGDLYSDTLVAYLDSATHTIRYAEATGHVRIHQEKNTALSERAIYEPAIGKITLVGKPSLLVYPSEKPSGAQQLTFGVPAAPVKGPSHALPAAAAVHGAAAKLSVGPPAPSEHALIVPPTGSEPADEARR